DGHQIIGRMAQDLPDNHHPSELPTIMTPRLIELCFQTAGVWEMGIQGRMGLPRQIESVSSSLPGESRKIDRLLYAIVTPDEHRGTFDADVIDSRGNRVVSLRGYRTVAIPNAVESEPMKALRAAMSLEAVAV
ncbi:MAG TPA: polyketide synthase dehydratase domain-containing protein, partial [Tepidiformaceae bacterium]|nr:polyketide synthase dehydratase domain-containing protein [Tepidiformaceae bacterium]